jgi:hypothetical protein
LLESTERLVGLFLNMLVQSGTLVLIKII